jgi:hypothetical protein
MDAITSTGGKIYIHSEYITEAQLNKLPQKVKEIILKAREKQPQIIEEVIPETL